VVHPGGLGQNVVVPDQTVAVEGAVRQDQRSYRGHVELVADGPWDQRRHERHHQREGDSLDDVLLNISPAVVLFELVPVPPREHAARNRI